jgi:tetratricopeptide (TPR) repeat protein
VIASAYYQMKDYRKVVELLEREEVAKDYSVLLLLGNSCLELKKLQTAAEYFEKLRKYGDTVKNNRVLGAIYYYLGEREKAQVYYERAKELEKKRKKKIREE